MKYPYKGKNKINFINSKFSWIYEKLKKIMNSFFCQFFHFLWEWRLLSILFFPFDKANGFIDLAPEWLKIKSLFKKLDFPSKFIDLMLLEVLLIVMEPLKPILLFNKRGLIPKMKFFNKFYFKQITRFKEIFVVI